MLPAAAGAAAGATVLGGDPPSGPPTGVEMYEYGGGLTGILWVNADPLAGTQIGLDEGGVNYYPPVAGPGVTTFETGTSIETGWYARHVLNGQYSAWVEADAK